MTCSIALMSIQGLVAALAEAGHEHAVVPPGFLSCACQMNANRSRDRLVGETA